MGKGSDDDHACCESCKLYGDAPPYEAPADAEATALRAPYETVKVVVTQRGMPYAEVLPDKDQINVGRVASNEVQLDDCTISRRQMVIKFDPRGVIVSDERSTCGTFINGGLIHNPTLVPEGATISCGNFELRILPR